MAHSKQIREQVENCLVEERWQQAHLRLGDFWRSEAKAASANFVLSCYEKIRGHVPLAKCGLAFLRSFTVEPLVPILRSAGLVAGIDATVQVGQFNSYAQEILITIARLYCFNPDIVFLAIQTRDIAPELWDGLRGSVRSAMRSCCRPRAAELFGVGANISRAQQGFVGDSHPRETGGEPWEFWKRSANSDN